MKFKGLCESILIQQGCHIIIQTDKYYVEANTEILFTTLHPYTSTHQRIKEDTHLPIDFESR